MDPRPSPSDVETRQERLPQIRSGGSEQYSLVSGEEDAVEVRTELPDIEDVERTRRYAPGPLLGEGGMGAIELRLDTRIGRRVAYKTLHPELDRSDLRRRFEREARAQAQLEHPAIVPVYDMGRDERGLFFTMKRVRGHTLARVLQGLSEGEPAYTTRFTERRLLASFLQVCQAVHYAHSRGVLHRDLKPSNVMIGELGEVYVLDWGLARIVGEQPLVSPQPPEASRMSVPQPVRPSAADLSRVTRTDTVLGTLAYMPPEQLSGPDVDARADVYALGVMLFEIVTRRRYRTQATYETVLGEAADGRIARPSDVRPDVDPELDAICARATATFPSDRYESAKALADALEQVLDGARDAEARSLAAQRHLERARSLLVRRDDPSGARVAAMHELMRAATLDPGAEEARQLLVDLVSDADGAVPDGARRDLERAKIAHRLSGLEGTMLALLSWLVPVPIAVAFMEVRSWPLLMACALPTVAALLFAGYARMRSWVGAEVGVILAALVSLVLVGASFILGPFVIVPTMAANCSMFFAIHLPARERWIVTSLLTFGAVAPFALDASGLVPPSLAIEGGHLMLLPRMLELPPVPTTLGLAWVSGSYAVFSALITGRFRDRLDRAEQRNIVSAWHLRALFAAREPPR